MKEEYGKFEKIPFEFDGEILIKYLDEEMPELYVSEKGNWIDLRSAYTYPYAHGDTFMINLGVSMKLPEGYEAIVVPRSSMFRNYGLMQTNSIGVIDNTFCGADDIWRLPVICVGTSGCIQKYDRVAQFRIIKSQHVRLKKVSTLINQNRGGFGSTGVN